MDSQGPLLDFVGSAPSAIALLDRGMRYLAASPRWVSDYGLAGEEVIGRSHYEVFPEIPERWREIHQRALGGEVITADDDRFDRADGSVQWLRWEIRPWHQGGAIGGIVMFTEDITARVVARQQIERLNADLEEVVRLRTAQIEEIKTLHGLLPICAYCKKIRDARGEWLQLERYLTTHTDAQLTHGFCPECAEANFG